jgi:hypothetical protein
MTAYRFYIWFGLFVELSPLFPLIMGITKWQILSMELRYFLLFLFSELLFYVVQDYLFYYQINNLFLYYFNSFFQNLFVLSYFYLIFVSKKEKRITLFLIVFGIIISIIDFLFISKMGNNYFAGYMIDLVLFITGSYYLKTYSLKISTNSFLQNANLLIVVAIIMQFFVKMIDIFLQRYFIETQNFGIVWLNEKIIYYYFMFFAFCVYTYIYYSMSNDKN